MNGDRRQEPPSPALIEEADAITGAPARSPLLCTSVVLAAWRGQENRALELIAASIQDATAEGRARAICLGEYAQALLYNGLGRYHPALAAAQRACERQDPRPSARALTELVEAGSRTGSLDVAAAALRRLKERTHAAGAGSALGLRFRSRALLSDRKEADGLYREAVGRLATGRVPLHKARAQLLYGEWLRRENRRVDARDQLRAAHGVFNRIGADGFAERARRELLATGEHARKRTVETRDDLTAQERQIAELAGDGLSNPEIGARLFLSPRTVEWHLRKVFIKLGINSRRELANALPVSDSEFVMA